MRRHVSRRQLPLVAIVMTAAVSFPLGVLASHRFTDVPTSNTFHADIDAIAAKGVTTGCATTKYCPKDFVTREQMAAFLNRLGALGPGKTPVVNADKVDGLQASQFVRSDVPTTGQQTCAGSSMLPTDSSYAYGTDSNSVYVKAAPGHFRCQYHLPDGATILGFTAVIHDASTTEYAQCALDRHSRASAGFVHISTAPASAIDNPAGDWMLEAPSVSSPTVSNLQYVYTAVCSIYGFGTDMGVIAATVTYRVSGAPVE